MDGSTNDGRRIGGQGGGVITIAHPKPLALATLKMRKVPYST